MTDALSALKSLRAWIAEWQRFASVGILPAMYDLSTALREADEAIAACGWLEIAECPLDQDVLFWHDGSKYQARGSVIGHMTSMSFLGPVPVFGCTVFQPGDATHWQPLPESPAALRQIEGKAE